MGSFRALKPLQASSIGLVQPGQTFEWSGNIIGWHVEALDDDARRMVAERAEKLAKLGGAAEDKPLPTQPFPKGVMKVTAGMSAPAIVAGTLGADTPAPDESAPKMDAPPRRRKQG